MKKPKRISVERFDYHLPVKLISQRPTKPRDSARLLILARSTSKIEHQKFYNIIDHLERGDTLVLNNSKVIPARLIGNKKTGGKIEIFLLTKKSAQTWQCLIRGKTKEDQERTML